MSYEERTHNEEVKKEIGERNTPRPVRVGAVEIAGTGVESMEKTGVIGVAREVAVGISMFVATLGSSKVIAI